MSSIFPVQIRAARAMLHWSLLDLSRAARLSIVTIKRVEDGRPGPIAEEAFALIEDALTTEGVRFLPDDGNGPGVRLRIR